MKGVLIMGTDIVIQLKELAASLGREEGRSIVYGAATEIKNLRENDFESIAKELYEALMVMCQRRGIHHDDVDQVLDVRERYEGMVKQSV